MFLQLQVRGQGHVYKCANAIMAFCWCGIDAYLLYLYFTDIAGYIIAGVDVKCMQDECRERNVPDDLHQYDRRPDRGKLSGGICL